MAAPVFQSSFRTVRQLLFSKQAQNSSTYSARVSRFAATVGEAKPLPNQDNHNADVRELRAACDLRLENDLYCRIVLHLPFPIEEIAISKGEQPGRWLDCSMRLVLAFKMTSRLGVIRCQDLLLEMGIVGFHKLGFTLTRP